MLALFPRQKPSAQGLLTLSEDQLRAAGLSRSKARSLLDIAAKKMEGVVPTALGIARMTEQHICERLIRIRGVGPRTVEMLLIFSLRRPDVIPSTDYGVRKGIQLQYRKRSLPTPKEVANLAEHWSPYRTTAASGRIAFVENCCNGKTHEEEACYFLNKASSAAFDLSISATFFAT